MIKVKNKWNGQFYKVIGITDNIVILEREDGSRFTNMKKEYFINYFEKK